MQILRQVEKLRIHGLALIGKLHEPKTMLNGH